MRILFASIHGYIDPSSGAALTTRNLLESLAARGHDCRVFSSGVLDFEKETSLEVVLAPLCVPVREARAALSRGGTADVLDLNLKGVRATFLRTASSRPDRSPSPTESRNFLDLADQVLTRFRPEIVLTYGGHPAGQELIAQACRRGIPVVFHLHNFAYTDRRFFVNVSAVLVPSEFSRRHHAAHLGLESTAIAPPLLPEQVIATAPEPRYLTFVNPVPAKGVTIFARIASEVNRLRPDIPLLVVEARGMAEGMASAGLDLSGLENLHRMASTPDPRHFYRVSRAVLMPSLCLESFGRVAAEALANGIPVLASDRGALPETLGGAGAVLAIPARCTPTGGEVPTADEVVPWVRAVEQLWDDPAFEAEHRTRAREEARRWGADRLVDEYEEFFRRTSGSSRP